METQINSKVIDKELFQSAFSYDGYMELLNKLYGEGKTTGDNHSEAMLNYAKINLQRMNRLNKTIILSNELKETIQKYNTSKRMTWLVITEGWCGDAAQNLPLIHKIAESTNQIELKLILRDENLSVMDSFLTNGGRSIPKMIVLEQDNLNVIGTWGPRPEVAQEMVREFKKKTDGDYPEFQKQLQLWYAKDKTQSQQNEFIHLHNDWNSNNN